MTLAARTDVLMEGYRPGVMERLGLGPDDLESQVAGLIYTRITGWGRNGVYAGKSGHDLNYVALSGALACIGPSDNPPPPVLNLLGDSAGGMLAAIGVLAALVERAKSGRGQTVDVAMLDAATSLMASVYGKIAAGTWHAERGANFIDGGAPFYGVYETADHRYVSVGAIEPIFYRRLLSALGLMAEDMPQWDRDAWPGQRRVFRDVFATRTRAEWEARFANEDCCFAPVLGPDEASSSPHNVQRGTFVKADGHHQPAPAPRFGRTPGQARLFHAAVGEHTDEVMAEWTAAPDRSLFPDAGRP
jgi:alpha-methylacyl-CoA racemase